MTAETEIECDICADGPEECRSCLDDAYADCIACGGSGYCVPEHCCACGGSPYCQCCPKCGASCMGSCRCTVTVQLQDGGTLTIPGSAPDCVHACDEINCALDDCFSCACCGVQEARQPSAQNERDHHQEHKDGVAMGYIDRDGNPLEPDEPDWGEYEGGSQ